MGTGSGLWLATVTAAALATSGGSAAQRPSHDEERARDSDICGYRLMTERERTQYREQVRAARTDEERDRIRNQHGDRMRARAKERGVVLSCAESDRAARSWNDGGAVYGHQGGVQSAPGGAPVLAVRNGGAREKT